MDKNRKNFSAYNTPVTDSKKADAKKILSGIMESLNVDQLNALYQKKEVPENKPAEVVKPVMDQEPTVVDNLQPVSDTFATMSQDSDGKLIISFKRPQDPNKPVRVIFKDGSQAGSPILAEAVIRRKIKVMDKQESKKESKKEATKEDTNEDTKDSDYDALDSAPELDLSNDPVSVSARLNKPSNKDDSGYDPLEAAPPLVLDGSSNTERDNELLDVVRNGGGGMMTNVVALKHELPVAKPVMNKDSFHAMPGKDNIRKIEDDIEGYSVAGIDNNIGLKML